MARLFLLLLALPHAAALSWPREGRALFETSLVSGKDWGLSLEKASKKTGPASEWFLRQALENLWRADSADFSRVELSSGSWLILHDEKLFGYVTKVPATDQEFYGALGRQYVGPSRIIHMEETPRAKGSDLDYFIHCVWFQGEKTNLVLMTATPKLATRSWKDPETGAAMRVELLYKAGDPGIPLYLIFWDSQRP